MAAIATLLVAGAWFLSQRYSAEAGCRVLGLGSRRVYGQSVQCPKASRSIIHAASAPQIPGIQEVIVKDSGSDLEVSDPAFFGLCHTVDGQNPA